MSIKLKAFNSLKKIAVLFIVLVLCCGIYLIGGYEADRYAIVEHCAKFKVTKSIDGRYTSFYGDEINAGLIFYPGGKVESASYEPLMMSLADKGILCILVDMPFDLAVFDINAAEGITDNYPEIKNWYMAGHSLGGAMASSFVSENRDDFDGIIFLGAYSSCDISDTDIKALSIYGSKDEVMNKEKYIESMAYLPSLEQYVIQGGNHAYFGMYGEQKGDGKAEITNEEQINITAFVIADFIYGN